MHNSIKNISLASTILHCVISTIFISLFLIILGYLFFGWGTIVDALYDFGNINEFIESVSDSLDSLGGVIFVGIVIVTIMLFSIPVLLLIISTICGFVTYYKHKNLYAYNLFLFTKKFTKDAILKMIINILLIAMSIYNFAETSFVLMCILAFIFTICLALNIVQIVLCQKAKKIII